MSLRRGFRHRRPDGALLKKGSTLVLPFCGLVLRCCVALWSSAAGEGEAADGEHGGGGWSRYEGEIEVDFAFDFERAVMLEGVAAEVEDDAVAAGLERS